MARTSSLNGRLSCRNPYQTTHSLNPAPLLIENHFFSLKSALRRIPCPKLGLLLCVPSLSGVFFFLERAVKLACAESKASRARWRGRRLLEVLMLPLFTLSMLSSSFARRDLPPSLVSRQRRDHAAVAAALAALLMPSARCLAGAVATSALLVVGRPWLGRRKLASGASTEC